MATISPLRGLRYDEKQAGQINSLVTPPYDVIDTAAQEGYYQRNPYNIIRLEYGLKYPDDNETNNRYTRAAEFFSRWQNEGILRSEDNPAFYLYRQEFNINGKTYIRSGLFCRVMLEPYENGVILPHEETMPKHKADRLALMETCNANFSPIFGIYSDRDHEVDSQLDRAVQNRRADIDFVDEWGHGHRLWVIDDPKIIQQVQSLMKAQRVLIADGHHRYETALKYARDNPGNPEAGYLLMVLVNLYDPGLVILPTHRLITKTGVDREQLINALRQDFEIQSCGEKDAGAIGKLLADMAQLNEDEGIKSRQVLGLYLGDGQFYTLALRDKNVLSPKMPADHSQAWQTLDVSVLQYIILENILGIDKEALAGGEAVHYTRDTGEAMKKVDDGTHKMAFIMNPTLIAEVTEVAANGEKMPQKSTFFYPKMITGLVINKF